jgi:4-hydroxy-2-oxoheptanedioate aldolase
MRYPPQGMRSSGPFRATLYAGSDYQDRANDELLLAVMIETPKALENLEEIAGVPGIDVLYIGPSDLSQALGLGPRYNADNPKHAETVTRIREVCERHGVIAGVHTSGNVLTSRYLQEGFKMIMLTTDSGGIVSGAQRELGAIQEALKEASAVRA